MRIKWLIEAGQDLVDIRSFIAAERPGAAAQVAKRVGGNLICPKASNLGKH